ncbi:hypothetical protein GGX14DRAFT_655325, partial [Mycena pura]
MNFSLRDALKCPKDLKRSRIQIFHPVSCALILDFDIRPLWLGTHWSSSAAIPTHSVLTFCAIITGTYNKDFLSLHGPHPERDSPDDPIPSPGVSSNTMLHGIYTLLVKDNTNYPVFKSFDEWKPPSRKIVPDEFFTTTFPKQVNDEESDEESMLWEGAKETLGGLSVTEAATTMDQHCAFTGEVCHLEGAHICFKSDREWYKDKKVHRQLYDRNHYPRKDNSGVDDLRNIITLGVKPHTAWDAHQLAILPLIPGTFALYFLDSKNNDLAARCHCATIELPERTDGYLVFIRLAKTVFNYLLPDAWGVPTHPSSQPTPKSRKRERSDDGAEGGGDDAGGRHVAEDDGEGDEEEEDQTTGGGAQQGRKVGLNARVKTRPTSEKENWLKDVAAACAEDGIDFPADLEACLPSLMKETRRLEKLRQQALVERRRVDLDPNLLV